MFVRPCGAWLSNHLIIRVDLVKDMGLPQCHPLPLQRDVLVELAMGLFRPEHLEAILHRDCAADAPPHGLAQGLQLRGDAAPIAPGCLSTGKWKGLLPSMSLSHLSIGCCPAEAKASHAAFSLGRHWALVDSSGRTRSASWPGHPFQIQRRSLHLCLSKDTAKDQALVAISSWSCIAGRAGESCKHLC